LKRGEKNAVHPVQTSHQKEKESIPEKEGKVSDQTEDRKERGAS